METFLPNLAFKLPVESWFPVAAGVLTAAYTDSKWLKIPNVVTGPLLLSGLLYHCVFPGEIGIVLSLAGVFTAFVLLILPFALGGVGAGDLKLLMGIGAWIGPQLIFLTIALTSLLIAVVSIHKILHGQQRMSPLGQTVSLSQLFVPWREGRTVETVAAQDRETSQCRLVPWGKLVAIALLTLVIWESVRQEVETVKGLSQSAKFDLPLKGLWF